MTSARPLRWAAIVNAAAARNSRLRKFNMTPLDLTRQNAGVSN